MATNEEVTEDLRKLKVDRPSYSMFSGAPGVDTLEKCSAMLLEASQSLLTESKDIKAMFGYGPPEGAADFREELARFLSAEYSDTVDSSSLMVTAGASQGLHLLLTMLVEKTGVVFVEDPTYYCAIRIIQDDLAMELVPVLCDAEGIKTGVLEEMIMAHKDRCQATKRSQRFWAAMYLIPVSHNPTGWNYSKARCKEVIRLARKYDVLVICDDIYNLIYFNDVKDTPQRLYALDKPTDPDYGSGHVVSNGTFSKFLAPSLRLGWFEGPRAILELLYNSHVADSGGCFNHYTSQLLTRVMRSGRLSQHMKSIRTTFKRKRDAVLEILDNNLPNGCTYMRPKGGFFVWIKFHPEVDALKFVLFCHKNYKMSFVPGIMTSASFQWKNYARISLTASEEILVEAARRLCQAYEQYITTLLGL